MRGLFKTQKLHVTNKSLADESVGDWRKSAGHARFVVRGACFVKRKNMAAVLGTDCVRRLTVAERERSWQPPDTSRSRTTRRAERCCQRRERDRLGREYVAKSLVRHNLLDNDGSHFIDDNNNTKVGFLYSR